MGALILGLVGLAACDSSEEDTSGATNSVQANTSTADSVSTLSADAEPPLTEPVVEDGIWELRIDRRGGSEDPEEAFAFLPEARYQPVANGPTYRVVISEQGSQASVEGTRGDAQFVEKGMRASTTGEYAWYDLTDAFAGGRFVVWSTKEGLQGEFTVYGSGRPIIFSERGALIEAP